MGSFKEGDKHDDFLGTTLQVSRRLLLGCENTSRLNDIFGTSILPWNVARITFLIHLNDLAIDDKIATSIGRNLALEVAMGGVVLEHIDLWNRELDYPQRRGCKG